MRSFFTWKYCSVTSKFIMKKLSSVTNVINESMHHILGKAFKMFPNCTKNYCRSPRLSSQIDYLAKKAKVNISVVNLKHVNARFRLRIEGKRIPWENVTTIAQKIAISSLVGLDNLQKNGTGNYRVISCLFWLVNTKVNSENHSRN